MTGVRTGVPAPRQALRRAEDGKVHPAAAHLSSLAVEMPRSERGGGGGGKAKKDKAVEKVVDDKDDRVVELTVAMPKSVRKALRRRAEEFGWTAEEAAAHVLRVWAGT